jgi:hypothetical protein
VLLLHVPCRVQLGGDERFSVPEGQKLSYSDAWSSSNLIDQSQLSQGDLQVGMKLARIRIPFEYF